MFHENLMSNNFLKTAVLKKNMNRKLRLHSKDSIKKFGGPYLCLNFSRRLLRFSKCVFNFSRKIVPGRKNFFLNKCIEIFNRWF